MTKLRDLYEIYPAEPRATMPVGIRVDDWLYGSVSAIDPLTGRFEGDMPEQAQRSAAAMQQVLASAGMQATDVKSVRVYRAREDPRFFAALQAMFGAAVNPEGSSPVTVAAGKPPAMQVYDDAGQLAPGQRVRIDFTASIGGSEWAAKMLGPAVTSAPDAVQVGRVFWVPSLTAADPIDGSLPATIEAQVKGAFDTLERLLAREGVGRGQLLRIAGYMRDLKDKDLLNDAMVERFPVWSEKPVHKYVPCALPPGVEFALQALAVDGGERRILEIEGIKHNDPISLGAQVGNVFVSSRVQAQLEPSAQEQTARLIESHARRLVEHIGGSLADVTQMVWGIGDPSFEADVRDECVKHWPPEGMPRVDVILADFPHSPLPRLEFFALLGAGEQA